MILPWFDFLDGPLTKAAMDRFILGYCELCDGLPQEQVRARTGAIPMNRFEWALEQSIIGLIHQNFGECQVLERSTFRATGACWAISLT